MQFTKVKMICFMFTLTITERMKLQPNPETKTKTNAKMKQLPRLRLISSIEYSVFYWSPPVWWSFFMTTSFIYAVCVCVCIYRFGKTFVDALKYEDKTNHEMKSWKNNSISIDEQKWKEGARKHEQYNKDRMQRYIKFTDLNKS